MGARTHRLADVSTRVECELVIVGAADDVVLIGGVDRDRCLVAGAALVAIGLRLWFVQVKMADYYRGRIQGSSEVTVRIPSVRGEIRDRNGIPLVTHNRKDFEHISGLVLIA